MIFSMESEPKVQNTRFTHHALGKKVVRKMEDQLLEYMQKELGRLLQGLCSLLTHFHSQTDVESVLQYKAWTFFFLSFTSPLLRLIHH